MKVQPGHTGTYTSTEGYQKAAFVVATHESVEPDTNMVQPTEGHVHLAIFGITDPMHPWIIRPDVPLREVAEAIPDYTINGKLVGFFEPLSGSITPDDLHLNITEPVDWDIQPPSAGTV